MVDAQDMNPDKPETRLLNAAGFIFATAGFHRAHISEIANAADTALGTLYRHFGSKEELYVDCMLFHARMPKTDPRKKRKWVHDLEGFLSHVIAERLSASAFGWTTTAEAGHENSVSTITNKLYEALFDYAVAVRMIDRSTIDWPAAGALFDSKVRNPVLETLEHVIAAASANGAIKPVTNKKVSARIILETCAWFAIHRRFTYDASTIGDEEAKIETLNHINRSFGVITQNGDNHAH